MARLFSKKVISSEKGQSLVESAIVIVLMSVILFGMLQVAIKFHAEQVQQWAMFAGARSRIVGFNDSVVQKAWFVGNIMNSGAMLDPYQGLSSVAQVGMEDDLIGTFLQSSGTAYELAPQLNYAGWKTLPQFAPYTTADQFMATGEQDFPLVIAQLLPILAASFGTTNVVLHSDVTLENHFPFYLNVN
jgi:hypothetical protein